MKKNIIVLSIISIITISLIVLGIFLKDNKSNSEPETQKKINNDAYGYLVIIRDNEDNLIELNKNSKDKVILNSNKDSGIYGLTIKRNNFYFYVHQFHFAEDGEKEDFYKIDLNNGILEKLYSFNDFYVDMYSNYFDIENDYIFTIESLGGIKRYNVNTKESKIFLNNYYVNNLFILNSELYFEGEEIASGNFEYNKVDSNGDNITKLEKEDYDNAQKEIGLKNVTHDIYLIKNNKKITISEDESEILVDNEIVYEAKQDKNKFVELMYIQRDNYIAFNSYNKDSGAVIDEKYYLYDVETKELLEVDETIAYHIYRMVLIEK